jgi:hypothetical protein
MFFVVTPLADSGSPEPLTGLPILKPARTGPGIAHAESEDYCSQELIGLRAIGKTVFLMPYDTASNNSRRLTLAHNMHTLELT